MRKIIYLFVVFLVTSACILSNLGGSLSKNKESTQTLTPSNSQSIEQPTEQPSIAGLPIDTTSHPCQGEKWAIEPNYLYSIPAYQNPGWQYVFINFAIFNGSDFWGTTRLTSSDLSITTEGDFVYGAPDTRYVLIQNNTEIPFPFPFLLDFNRDANADYLFPSTSETLDELLPPQFSTEGMVSVFPNAYNVFIFKVADTQKELTLKINQLSLNCLINGENKTDTIPEISFDLNNLNPKITFPVTLSNDSFTSLLGNSLKVPDLGTINFTKVNRGSEEVMINFTFTNANIGGDSSGQICGYLIGDDGIVRKTSSAEGMFAAGPGLTVDGHGINVKVPSSVENLKFIVRKDPNWDYCLDINRVYNLIPAN